MSTTQLRRKLKETVDSLPAESLRSAADFLSYLGEHANPDDVSRLAKVTAFRRRLRAAERDVAAARLTSADKLRRKY